MYPGSLHRLRRCCGKRRWRFRQGELHAISRIRQQRAYSSATLAAPTIPHEPLVLAACHTRSNLPAAPLFELKGTIHRFTDGSDCG